MTDKQVIQQALLPFILTLIANRGLNSENKFYTKLAEEVTVSYLYGKDKAKLIRRLDRIAKEVIDYVVNSQTDIVNTHKLILVIHNVAEKIIEGGFALSEKVVELFQPFLEIEGNQDKTVEGEEITEADWLSLKTSADKIADKVFTNINKQLEYY